MSATYNPAIFETPDLASAREIILTAQDGMATDERWERETPYLAELLGAELNLKPGQMVVDYGCGVGRLAKALIERFEVLVIGVDISQQMRGMAPGYVDSPAFSAVSRRALDGMARSGFRADAAICAWVLQHCLKPAEDVRLIRRSMRPGGRLGVVNNQRRAVPAIEHTWVDDGVDVRGLLAHQFRVRTEGRLDPLVVGKLIAEHTFWAAYE